VLCIGMGIGVVPMALAREGVRVDVAEINPDVVPLARRWFGLEPERLNLWIGDGRYFVNRSPAEVYDAVVLDAFLGDASPSHLMTREAFAGMKRVLTADGVLVINAFGNFAEGRDFFTISLYKSRPSGNRSSSYTRPRCATSTRPASRWCWTPTRTCARLTPRAAAS
jgi:spermidine synthase